MTGYIYKHIVRAPSKSLLSMAVALAFTLALGILQNNITSLEAEIDRIYAETVVNAEIRICPNFIGANVRRLVGDIVPTPVVRDILALGVVRETYLEAGATAFLMAPSISPLSILEQPVSAGGLDTLVGIRELRHLTEAPDGFIGRDLSFDMEVQFSEGFSEHSFDSFLYTDNAVIPVILSRELEQKRGLTLGDSFHIIYYRPILFRRGEWLYNNAVVAGIHNGEGLPNNVRDGAVVPLNALEALLGDFTGFFTFKFSIDPAFNRELATVSEQIDGYLAWPLYPWREQLAVDIFDQELRFGAASLRQQALLFQMLFPVAVGISAVIGVGLGMLTMLQNAKNAAIMRVLGMSKPMSQLVLWVWQMIICVSGGLIGLLLTVTVVGLRTNLIVVIVPYLAGAMIGAAVGAILITSRAPLDLLQVKE